MLYTIGAVLFIGSVCYPIGLWVTMKGVWYLNKLTMVGLYEKCVRADTKESLALADEVRVYLDEYYTKKDPTQ